MAGILDSLKGMFGSATDELSDRNYGHVFDIIKKNPYISAAVGGFFGGKMTGMGGFKGFAMAVIGMFAVPKLFNMLAPKNEGEADKGAAPASASDTEVTVTTNKSATPEKGNDVEKGSDEPSAEDKIKAATENLDKHNSTEAPLSQEEIDKNLDAIKAAKDATGGAKAEDATEIQNSGGGSKDKQQSELEH